MSRAIKPAKKVDLKDLDSFNMAKNVNQQAEEISPESSEETAKPSPKNKEIREAKTSSTSGADSKDTEKKFLPKEMSQKVIDNFLRYDRSADKGMSMSIPTELNDALKKISNGKYKRLSARTIASAILAAVIENYDIDTIIDQFFERIHYTTPTDEQLEDRRKATERVKKYRNK